MTNKTLINTCVCRIITVILSLRLNLIINDKVLMFVWLSVNDKKVAHPNEIQNTFVPSYYTFYEVTLFYLRRYSGFHPGCLHFYADNL